MHNTLQQNPIATRTMLFKLSKNIIFYHKQNVHVSQMEILTLQYCAPPLQRVCLSIRRCTVKKNYYSKTFLLIQITILPRNITSIHFWPIRRLPWLRLPTTPQNRHHIVTAISMTISILRSSIQFLPRPRSPCLHLFQFTKLPQQ